MPASTAFEVEPQASKSAWRSGLAGFGLQLSNPKAIFFWLAVASVGGVGDAPLSVILIFIVGALVNSFVGHGGYALLLSSKPVRRLYVRFHRWIEGTLGWGMVMRSEYPEAIKLVGGASPGVTVGDVVGPGEGSSSSLQAHRITVSRAGHGATAAARTSPSRAERLAG